MMMKMMQMKNNKEKRENENIKLYFLSGDRILFQGINNISMSQVAKRLHRDENSFILVRNGKRCNDVINGKQATYLVTCTKPIKSCIKTLVFRLPGGESVAMDVRLYDSVNSVRLKIARSMNKSPSELKLICSGKILCDEYLVGDYLGLLDSKPTRVLEVVNPSRPMPIRILLPFGLGEMNIQARTTDTIKVIRNQVELHTEMNLPPERWRFQRLVREVLNDSDTLELLEGDKPVILVLKYQHMHRPEREQTGMRFAYRMPNSTLSTNTDLPRTDLKTKTQNSPRSFAEHSKHGSRISSDHDSETKSDAAAGDDSKEAPKSPVTSRQRE